MKKLLVIIGANGVGKTTTAQVLLQKLSKCAYVDADWCRAMHPFAFTEATKTAATNNIYCLLKNYLLCQDIEYVIFPYGFHGERKEIFEKVMGRLKEEQIAFERCTVVLKCSREENIKRAVRDGRDPQRIKRGMENTFAFYDAYPCPIVDTTDLCPDQAAEKIMEIFNLP